MLQASQTQDLLQAVELNCTVQNLRVAYGASTKLRCVLKCWLFRADTSAACLNQLFRNSAGSAIASGKAIYTNTSINSHFVLCLVLVANKPHGNQGNCLNLSPCRMGWCL